MCNVTIAMEFDGKIAKFNIYDTMRYPNDVSSIYVVDVINLFVQELFKLNNKDNQKVAVHNQKIRNLQNMEKDFITNYHVQDTTFELEGLSGLASGKRKSSFLSTFGFSKICLHWLFHKSRSLKKVKILFFSEGDHVVLLRKSTFKSCFGGYEIIKLTL